MALIEDVAVRLSSECKERKYWSLNTFGSRHWQALANLLTRVWCLRSGLHVSSTWEPSRGTTSARPQDPTVTPTDTPINVAPMHPAST